MPSGAGRATEAAVCASDGSWRRMRDSRSRRSRAWLEPELGAEDLSAVSVALESVGLPAAPVQREHELLAEPLHERIGGNELLELGDELGMTARLRDPHRSGARARGAGARSVARRTGREALVGEIREGLAAEEREGLAQRRRQRPRPLLRGARAERLDLLHVGLTFVDPEQIAPASRLEPLRSRAACAAGTRTPARSSSPAAGGVVAPELVDEPIGRDRLRSRGAAAPRRARAAALHRGRAAAHRRRSRAARAGGSRVVRPGSRPTLAGRQAPSRRRSTHSCRLLAAASVLLAALRQRGACQWSRAERSDRCVAGSHSSQQPSHSSRRSAPPERARATARLEGDRVEADRDRRRAARRPRRSVRSATSAARSATRRCCRSGTGSGTAAISAARARGRPRVTTAGSRSSSARRGRSRPRAATAGSPPTRWGRRRRRHRVVQGRGRLREVLEPGDTDDADHVLPDPVVEMRLRAARADGPVAPGPVRRP